MNGDRAYCRQLLALALNQINRGLSNDAFNRAFIPHLEVLKKTNDLLESLVIDDRFRKRFEEAISRIPYDPPNEAPHYCLKLATKVNANVEAGVRIQEIRGLFLRRGLDWQTWEATRSIEGLVAAMSCDVELREDVARVVEFVPDEIDHLAKQIVAMLDNHATPGFWRTLWRTITTQPDDRATFIANLVMLFTSSRVQVNAYTGAATDENRGLLVEALGVELARLSPGRIEGIWDYMKWPRTFPLVLSNELRQVRLLRLRRRHPHPRLQKRRVLSHIADEAELVGLAFSGGGIRSATFNLGVLQGLAELKFGGRSLLAHFDYLSTVSGGGYIGTWLGGWIKRKSFDAVNRALAPSSSPGPDEQAVQPISFLRKYSNYLTPKLGFFSADSWTLSGVYLRNVTLNLAILISGFAAILLLPRLLAWDVVHGFPQTPVTPLLFWLAPVLAMLLLAFSLVMIALNLRVATLHDPPGGEPYPPYSQNSKIQYLAVIPLLLSAYFFCKWFWVAGADSGLEELDFSRPWIIVFTSFFLAMLALLWFGGYRQCFLERRQNARLLNTRFTAGLFSIAGLCSIVGVVLMRGFFAVLQWLGALPNGQGPWHLLICGPVLLLSVFSLVMILQIGLMGLDFPDSGREWLSRLRAWTNIYSLVWIALMGTAIYGPLVVAWLVKVPGKAAASAVTTTWVLTTLGGVLAGKNSSTGVKEDGTPKSSKLDILAKIGPVVFIVGFLLMLTFLLNLLVSHTQLGGDWGSLFDKVYFNHWKYLFNAPMLPNGDTWFLSSIIPLLGLLAVVTLVLSWRVDINEFSMHHFYKNRLARCYLGASRCDGRKPNPFTGFDEDDDFRLSELTPSSGYDGPYPIVNATLNLTTGDQLAWQERKAASFVFTPCYSGFELWKNSDHLSPKLPSPDTKPFGFRRTENYAYPGRGVHAGTVTAISGAAVSPNHGYHTSTAVAFLLTVFNVRMGWWMGNPRSDKKSSKSSPTFGLTYLIKELLGLTDSRAGFVSLSDGGHFENLAIYELVRRRCKFIVACDAEQDPAFSFSGLGNAVRKCRTDFGVDIDIQPRRIARSRETKRSVTHCVVGTIHYPDSSDGALVYIKSSLVGDEPEDVLQYAAAHAEFPHQTTGDQWFDESQFESYRTLGYHIAEATFLPALNLAANLEQTGTRQLFDALKSIWYPPSEAIAAHATKHTQTYTRLLDTLGGNQNLRFLDAELFPAKGSLPHASTRPTPQQEREAFYFCASLIQLLEDIYIDFGLEIDSRKEHPHVEGWISLYRGWVRTRTMKRTWRGVRGTYNSHFRAFWNGLGKWTRE